MNEKLNINKRHCLFLIFLSCIYFVTYSQINKNTNNPKKLYKIDEDGWRVRIPNRDFILDKSHFENGQIQEPNFDEKLVIQEIASLLDSIREYMYECTILKTEVDTIANKGAEHHNKYLKNVIDTNDEDAAYLNHCELKKDRNCFYNGKDTLIPFWRKRMEHFSDGTMGFCGEVCSAGSLTFISTKGLTPKEIAKKIIYSFHHSKEHWRILTHFGYTKIAADFEIRKNSKGGYIYWFTMCTGYKIIITKSKTKNMFYSPNNPKYKNDSFRNTEYIEVIDEKLVYNK